MSRSGGSARASFAARGWRRSALASDRPNSARFRKFAAIAGFFALWEIAALLAGSQLFPTPDVAVSTLVEDLANGVLLSNAKVTFARAFTGLGIALVVGIALGVAMARNRVVQGMLEPLLAALYPVPKLALYPLLILILGFGAWSKIALVALECTYPILYNTFSGVQGIQKRYFWVARNVGAGRMPTVGMAMRAASPSLFAGLRVAVPVMLVIITITELLGESVGLGFLIRDAGTQFAPDQAMAVILFLGICGYVLDRLVVWSTHRAVFWQESANL